MPIEKQKDFNLVTEDEDVSLEEINEINREDEMPIVSVEETDPEAKESFYKAMSKDD